MTTRRFSPPPTHLGGGAVPYDGMEHYRLDEATDEELQNLIDGDFTPAWLINEARIELQSRNPYE